jgi:hypothetical protein
VADVKISDLTAEASPATSALVEVENSGASRKSTLAQIWTAVRATAKTYFDGIYSDLAHTARHAAGGADALTGLATGQMPTMTYITPDAANAHTFEAADSGKCVRFTDAGANTITFPDTLTAGLYGWVQRAAGAGAVTWAVSGDMVVTPAAESAGHTKTAAAPSFLWWTCDEENSVIISGDTAA